MDKFQSWFEGAVLLLPNILLALIIFFGFFILGKIFRRLTKAISTKFGVDFQVSLLISTSLYFICLFMGIFFFLSIVELDRVVFSLLAGAGILGLMFALAFQTVGSAFIAGFYLLLKRPFTIGDIIESNEKMGVVERIRFRATQIRTFDGQIVYIPNQRVFASLFINYSLLGARRVEISVGVSYQDNLEKVKNVSIHAIEMLPCRDKAKTIEVYFNEFAESAITLTLYFWIPFQKQADYLKAKSDAIMAVKTAYEREGISIPFPTRTLKLGRDNKEKIRETLMETGFADV